jgi:hypothetical protein
MELVLAQVLVLVLAQVLVLVLVLVLAMAMVHLSKTTNRSLGCLCTQGTGSSCCWR